MAFSKNGWRGFLDGRFAGVLITPKALSMARSIATTTVLALLTRAAIHARIRVALYKD